MHCNHRCYECHIPACPDRVRQSIGPRIVPMFADPPEWSADKVYSPLTLVIHNGATYMSRRCVPANTALPDTDPFYNESWVMVYDMNAQVAQYREEVAQLSQQVTDFGCKIDNWEQLIVQWTALIQGWQNQFPELTKALAAITERVAAIEPKLDQALEDITALQTTQQTHTEQIAANTQGLADLTPRVAAAETHLSALDEEQKVQDEHLNNLDASQTEQDTRIQAAHDLAVQAKNTADNNTQQIAENAGKIAANAAEIAKHAEQLEALKAADTALDGKISQNTADIAQAKTDIKQAAAAAQQAQDTATHADAAASKAQTTAEAAQEAAEAAQSAADQAKADNTTQDGRLDALEAKITQEVEDRTEADNAIKQEIANLTDGTTELPYVKKSGDTMSGALNLPAPTENANAANKKYVDDADAVLDAAIKKEVKDRETAIAGIQTEIDGVTGDLSGYLPLTGGTMTGALNVQTPTEDANAATKKYVDDAVQNAADPELTGRVDALETSQAQQDTEIANLKNGTTALPYIKDTGDTVTGTYDFTGADLTVKAPTADASPATKAYVDNAVENASNPELESKVEALETSQAAQDTEISNLKNGTTTLPYLKKTGDTGTGTFNFTGAALQIAEPTQNNNPASKQYVDQAVAAINNPSGPNGHIVFEDAIFVNKNGRATITKESNDRVCVMLFTSGESSSTSTDSVTTFLWDDTTDQYTNLKGFSISSISSTSLSLKADSNGVIVKYKFVSDN